MKKDIDEYDIERDWPVPMTDGAYEAIEVFLSFCFFLFFCGFAAFWWHAYKKFGMIWIYEWIFWIAYFACPFVYAFLEPENGWFGWLKKIKK